MQPILTPCAGKCSTVFGDSVCRGCRRYSHEVIDWNTYNLAETQLIWARLDQQLDQIVLPLATLQTGKTIDDLFDFLREKHIRLPRTASLGRLVYEAIRLCHRAPERLVDACISVKPNEISALWDVIDARIYALAVASFELTWLRAGRIVSMPVEE